MAQSLLEQLRGYTTVVADTGDIEAMEKFRPTDATTNPSLITTAAQMPQYQPIVDEVLKQARNDKGESASDKDVANLAFQRLAIAFGRKILAIVPGRVSTEVDARLSYDTQRTIDQAHSIVAQYNQAGIDHGKHILIKIIESAKIAQMPVEADPVLMRSGGNRGHDDILAISRVTRHCKSPIRLRLRKRNEGRK